VFGLIAIVAALLRYRGRLYFWCTQQWSRAILWASQTPVYVHGLEHLRPDEPRVLVSNHISGYDIFALAAVMPGPFSFVGKKELNRIPFFGLAWQAAGHISIDRSNRARAMGSLRRAADKIRRERSTVIIFPEGTRSRSGQIQPFKKGAFVLALEAGLPVVPAVVVGSDRIQPAGSFRIRRRPVHLYFGEPVPASTFAPGELDALTGSVRSRMIRMQEEVLQRPDSATA
jgi:1-acyl-sn-glycerol-3-phosphate acyltransferase